MLNKPRHCQAAMVEEQMKKLSLIRGKVHMSKVKLTETAAQPDQFEGYIALEDFWPQPSYPQAKPQMLNGKSLSLLNQKKAEPWSVAAHPGVHRHHKAALAQTKSTPKKQSNSTNTTNASQVKIAAANSTNASKVQVVAPAKMEEKKAAPAKEVAAAKQDEKKAAPAQEEKKAMIT